jgi:hypothetical protein
MISHQNNHLKVAVLKEAFSKHHWKMSCAQKMSSDFKARNIFSCKPAAQIDNSLSVWTSVISTP